MLTTRSDICYIVLQNSFLFFKFITPLGSIPHILIASFRTSSSSSYIPWTSMASILTFVVFINFEQSHSTSSNCTQFWYGGGALW